MNELAIKMNVFAQAAGRFILWFAGFIGLMLVCNVASAAEGGLQLSQTRVIFDARAKDTQATIKNNSGQVYLIKADVFATPDGRNTQTDPKSAVPFMVTPPLFRLEPNSQNSVLIVRNGAAQLPADRESVFYLSFLAIPSTSDAAEGTQSGVSARISVGIQSVIKLFYRPSGLSMPASEAAKKLTFSNTEHGLGISNPTPYYVTLSRLNVYGKSMDVKGKEAGAMLAPFSTQYYPVNGTVRTVSWTTINDFGGESIEHQSAVKGI
ncbi:TPA: fimbrial biogenesis chaperone [Klebsiella pneumoniae]